MGTVIDHVSVVDGGWRERHSALRLAVHAASECLRSANRIPNDIDLLVNAGIYRDRNLGEPALAALIQHDLGANPGDPHPGAHGTFSFDVVNGTCGVLTALQIVDGFLRSRAIDRALVVASDADPGHKMSQNFPFSPVGAALLCSWRDDDSGLGPTYWINDPDGDEEISATVGMVAHRNLLQVKTSAGSDERLADAASQAAKACLHGSGCTVDDVDAIVAAPAARGYGTALAARLGVAPERITAAEDDRSHTASLASAFERARAGAPHNARILLVAAGAGITAGAALYRSPAPI